MFAQWWDFETLHCNDTLATLVSISIAIMVAPTARLIRRIFSASGRYCVMRIAAGTGGWCEFMICQWCLVNIDFKMSVLRICDSRLLKNVQITDATHVWLRA